MKPGSGGKPRRVAISIDLDWGFKRHLEVHAGCQCYADEAGWVCSINPAVDRLLKSTPRTCDGVIARATRALAGAARQARVPVVNVWLNSPVRDVPSVLPDLTAAGAMAAEHLLARGFRQFGYLGYLRDKDYPLQQKGFVGVIRRAGFTCTEHRILRGSIAGKARGWRAFIAGLEAWIGGWKRPIGVFVTQDLYCRYLIDVCRARGLHIPQEVGIVGCHNETAICDSPPPGITSIDLGYEEVGYRAAAMLDRLMNGEPPPAAPELVAPARLVPRQTTDLFAVEDPLVAQAMRLIAEKAHRPMGVKDLAVAMATTRRTLERRFREAAGVGIATEITRLRLERAKRRLLETEESMKIVARQSGFRTADHFYKVFTRVEGIPPTRFREERRNVPPKR
jgi:LacI family transcriptional regulator